MRPWIIVGVAVMAAVTSVSAQSERTAPPPVSSTPNLVALVIENDGNF
jgi:hypothetical protein